MASHGPTPAKAKRRLQEAVGLYLETATGHNLPYLRPVPPSENPLQTSPEEVVETFDLEVDLRLIARAA